MATEKQQTAKVRFLIRKKKPLLSRILGFWKTLVKYHISPLNNRFRSWLEIPESGPSFQKHDISAIDAKERLRLMLRDLDDEELELADSLRGRHFLIGNGNTFKRNIRIGSTK